MVASMAESPEVLLPPGFRFHPTDEELILHYLRNQVTSRPCPISIIAEINVYKFDPWDLPEKAAYGDREWYFFSPRDRKYPNGVRPNRAAASGYWKATGTDKPIVAAGPRKESIGVKKALVFYRGRPPKGLKTNWIMHEYRLPDGNLAGADRHKRPRDSSMRLDDWVLCRIYKKSNCQPSCSSDRDGDEYSLSEEASFPAGDGDASGAAKMTKTSSLTDLLDADFSILSRLLQETPSETASLVERRPLPGQPDLNQYPFLCFGGISAATSAAIPKLTDPAAMNIPPGAVPGYGLRGQRTAPPAAVYGEAAGGGAALECNTQLSPPFLHHQMLLNSRFGLP